MGEFTSPSGTSFDKEIHLSLADISVDCSSDSAPSMLFVRLKQSKTDQLRRGVLGEIGAVSSVPPFRSIEFSGGEG